MPTAIRQVCVRWVPLDPDEADLCRDTILELQVRSILRASKAPGKPPVSQTTGSGGTAAWNDAGGGEGIPGKPQELP